MQDVRRLDPGVAAAGEVHAVPLVRQRAAGGGIQLQQEDAARVGAVDQAQGALRIDEGLRIDDVGVHGGVVDLAVLPGLVPHPRAQEDPLVAVGALDVVGDRGAHRGAGRGAFAGAVVHAIAAVLGGVDVRRPQRGGPGPLEGLGELLGDVLEQRVLGGDQVRHARPPLQVAAARGGEVRAEDVEAAVRDDDGGVVHGDLLEGRGRSPGEAGRGRLAARCGQDARSRCREGGGRGDERAAGQGAHICSWRWGSRGVPPGGRRERSRGLRGASREDRREHRAVTSTSPAPPTLQR